MRWRTVIILGRGDAVEHDFADIDAARERWRMLDIIAADGGYLAVRKDAVIARCASLTGLEEMLRELPDDT